MTVTEFFLTYCRQSAAHPPGALRNALRLEFNDDDARPVAICECPLIHRLARPFHRSFSGELREAILNDARWTILVLYVLQHVQPSDLEVAVKTMTAEFPVDTYKQAAIAAARWALDKQLVGMGDEWRQLLW